MRNILIFLKKEYCLEICGSSIFEVGTEPQIADVHMLSVHSKNQTKTIGLKIPILIGIPVLILVILGVGYNQGFLDNVSERQALDDSIGNEIDSVDSSYEEILPTEINSKCGAGTIFDPDTNSCILPTEINSKCGAGTVFDPDTNSCILDKWK